MIVAGSSDEHDLQARCRAAIAILEAAMTLTTAANNEGPRGGKDIGPQVADLNRRISALQQHLLKLHDGKPV